MACETKQWLIDKQTTQVIASYDTAGVEAAFQINTWSDAQLVIVRDSSDILFWYLMDLAEGLYAPLKFYFSMQGTPSRISQAWFDPYAIDPHGYVLIGSELTFFRFDQTSITSQSTLT